MYLPKDLIFVFYVVSIFSFLLTTLFLLIKTYEYFKTKKNNNAIIKDLETGISFKKFLKELEILEDKSNVASILITGYRDFIDAYSMKDINSNSPLFLAKISMKELLQKEILLKEKYLIFFSLNSIISMHIGIAIFLLKIIESYEYEQVFFNCIINNLDILVVTIILSLYSSISYVFFKNISVNFYSHMKGYIECFLKYLYKEVILKND